MTTNTSDATIELLPCPFCGTKARYSYSEQAYYIECLGCRVEVKGGSYENITKRWNTRAYQASPECGWLPIEHWHEDMGAVLWTRLPIEEPPYCGTPLDCSWKENYYTHFTPLHLPPISKEAL